MPVNEYSQPLGASGTPIDTGFDPFMTGRLTVHSEISGSLIITTGGGIKYSVARQTNLYLMTEIPDVRVAVSSDFSEVNGTLSFEFWFDSVTETIKYQWSSSGLGGATLDNFFLTVRY